MSKTTAEQILVAAGIELERIQRRLIACRNRQYRESGNYSDDLAATISRMEFLLDDIMTGLVSPTDEKAPALPKREPARVQ